MEYHNFKQWSNVSKSGKVSYRQAVLRWNDMQMSDGVLKDLDDTRGAFLSWRRTALTTAVVLWNGIDIPYEGLRSKNARV